MVFNGAEILVYKNKIKFDQNAVRRRKQARKNGNNIFSLKIKTRSKLMRLSCLRICIAKETSEDAGNQQTTLLQHIYAGFYQKSEAV